MISVPSALFFFMVWVRISIIFFTGTAAEITPVTSVDGQAVGDASRGPVTSHLQGAFFEIVQGSADDRFGWLTSVEEE